jgi:peptidoglycan/xylan/chitin deacetylase (PgdA/CDA1 family)
MVALLNGQQQWRSLLEREGVPFRVLERTPAKEVPTARVLVVDGTPDEAGRHLLDDYIGRGAAILAGAGTAEQLLGRGKTRRARLAYVAPDDSALFVGLGVVDTDITTEMPVEAQHGWAGRRRGAVYTGSVGRCQLVILPFELPVLMNDTRAASRRFVAGRGRQPVERVSTVARGEVRRLIANCLRYLLARQGLPYVRLSPFPAGIRGLCGLRIDTDAGDDSSIERTLRILDDSHVVASWFVNTSNLPTRAALNRLSERGQDIQLHCFRHRVFPSYRESLDDIDAGRRQLAERGVRAVGYAAPFGEWNTDLQRAVADAGLVYSSEFAYSYDDLPVRPILDSDTSATLQVPVHPICLGALGRARTTTSDVLVYYENLARHRWARREPCLVYDHPVNNDESASLLQRTLEHLRGQCGNWTTLTNYVQWWRSRETVLYACSVTPDVIDLHLAGAVGRFEVIVEYEGREAWVELGSTEVRLSELDWRSLPAYVSGPRPDDRVRRPDVAQTLRETHRAWQRNLQKRRRRL